MRSVTTKSGSLKWRRQMPDDTKSPHIEEHKPKRIWIHFFRAPGRSPWWMRLGWRPTFSHVAVQWAGVIHHMPYNGAANWYQADEFFMDRKPDTSLSLPCVNQGPAFPIIAAIDREYAEKAVDQLGCVLWRFGWRRKRPVCCTGLVSLWIRLFTQIIVDEVMPDALFVRIRPHARLERQYGQPVSTK